MPNPRTPMGKAALTGAIAKNPQRYTDRADPVASGPIGSPPDCLSGAEKKAWKSFAKTWSWLTADDGASLTALCQMRAQIEDRKVDKTAAMWNTYRLMLSDFGGTPVSRSKVYAPKPDDGGDDFAGFGRAN